MPGASTATPRRPGSRASRLNTRCPNGTTLSRGDVSGFTSDMTQKMNLREYIDRLRIEGYTVRGGKGEDPILIAPDGSAVETWRDDYPYEKLLDRDTYEDEK